MAKSGHRSEHKSHCVHLSISSLSGRKYPRGLILCAGFRIFTGQNSIQIPHPLQYLSSIYSLGMLSYSLQIFLATEVSGLCDLCGRSFISKAINDLLVRFQPFRLILVQELSNPELAPL